MKNKEKYDLKSLKFKIIYAKYEPCKFVIEDTNRNLLFMKEEEAFSPFNTIQILVNWLEEEYKEPIKLSEDEKVILRNIDKKYKWIARDKNGRLYVYKERPLKAHTMWRNDDSGGMHMVLFNHLFQFIKWEDEEPYNIEELLKDE